MRPSAEGIMYPFNARSAISLSEGPASDGSVFTVPHSSWKHCSAYLDSLFSSLANRSFERIFVLGPLHKGPVGDLGDLVYSPSDGSLSGSDWSIELNLPPALRPLVSVSDDICSEECSLEIVSPYLSLLFPKVPVCHLLATGNVGKIVEILRKDFPSSLFLLSNNSRIDCGRMWKEAFGS